MILLSIQGYCKQSVKFFENRMVGYRHKLSCEIHIENALFAICQHVEPEGDFILVVS